jgi:acyl-CoA reductase-like NAD-dependent aldehyde dehydrogenase
MTTATHLTSINPATLETVGEIPIQTAADVAEAVRRCKVAQVAWGALSLQRRLHVLRRYQTVLVENRDRIVETIWKETSKPRTEALVEIFTVLEMIRHYRGTAAKLLAPRRVSSGLVMHKKAYKRFEPLGVVGVISPWNYPFLRLNGGSDPWRDGRTAGKVPHRGPCACRTGRPLTAVGRLSFSWPVPDDQVAFSRCWMAEAKAIAR